jgi:hypothetical protein
VSTQRPLSRMSHRAPRWRGLVTLTIVIVITAGLCQTSFGRTILGRLGLYEGPTSYTSLAFLHPQSLFGQLSPDKPIADVSFVIHNTSSAARSYQWSVSLVQEKHTSRVAAGTVRIASEGAISVSRSVWISCARGRAQIVVSLARPAEHINTRTACKPAR